MPTSTPLLQWITAVYLRSHFNFERMCVMCLCLCHNVQPLDQLFRAWLNWFDQRMKLVLWSGKSKYGCQVHTFQMEIGILVDKVSNQWADETCLFRLHASWQSARLRKTSLMRSTALMSSRITSICQTCWLIKHPKVLQNADTFHMLSNTEPTIP